MQLLQGQLLLRVTFTPRPNAPTIVNANSNTTLYPGPVILSVARVQEPLLLIAQ